MTKTKAVLFDYSGTLHDGISLIPDAIVILATLQQAGYVLGLVTTASTVPSGDARHFSVVMTGKDVMHRKPDPKGIQLALEHLSVLPHEAVMIGDSTADIYAARAAGLRASIGITTGFANKRELETAEADYIIGSLAELPALLAKLEQ